MTFLLSFLFPLLIFSFVFFTLSGFFFCVSFNPLPFIFIILRSVLILSLFPLAFPYFCNFVFTGQGWPLAKLISIFYLASLSLTLTYFLSFSLPLSLHTMPMSMLVRTHRPVNKRHSPPPPSGKKNSQNTPHIPSWQVLLHRFPSASISRQWYFGQNGGITWKTRQTVSIGPKIEVVPEWERVDHVLCSCPMVLTVRNYVSMDGTVPFCDVDASGTMNASGGQGLTLVCRSSSARQKESRILLKWLMWRFSP